MDYEETIEKFIEQFCDDYCKYPSLCSDQDQLEEKCNACPICKIVETLEQVEIPKASSEPSWKERFLQTFLGGR